MDRIDGIDGCRIYIDAHLFISTAFSPTNNNALLLIRLHGWRSDRLLI